MILRRRDTVPILTNFNIAGLDSESGQYSSIGECPEHRNMITHALLSYPIMFSKNYHSLLNYNDVYIEHICHWFNTETPLNLQTSLKWSVTRRYPLSLNITKHAIFWICDDGKEIEMILVF